MSELEGDNLRDVFSFEKRDAVVLAVIRALNSNGVDTTGVESVEKTGKEGKKKSKLYGKPLVEEDQQRSLYECDKRPYYLPRCKLF